MDRVTLINRVDDLVDMIGLEGALDALIKAMGGDELEVCLKYIYRCYGLDEITND